MALSLAACGGGSDAGDTPSTSLNENRVTYTELPSFIDVNEGEEVTLSLNTTGNNAKNLTFTWTVRGVNGDVPFTGQGSDTIKFTAPEVSQQSSLSISVKLEDSSNVIGFVNQFSSVSVADTDTNIIAPQPNTSNVVEALDLSVLTFGSTWTETAHQYIKTQRDDGGFNNVVVKLTRPMDIINVDQNDPAFTARVCGEQQNSSVKIAEFYTDIDCTEGTGSTVLTQNENSFTITRMCGENVAATSTFKHVSDTQKDSFGQLSVNFTNYPELSETAQVCGIIATTTVEALEIGGTNVVDSATATTLRLASEYEGSPLLLKFVMDDAPDSPFASISNVHGLDQKYAQLSTPVFPEISGLKNSWGTIDLSRDNTDTHIKADFDFTLPLGTFKDEEVTGSFELKLD
ncbi:hypothetical protein [Pseudoalteromonas rubra]|uniref:hypothetical protein n=1 Tax=Pseudoalteromonas rubra TaxID=43658 RepID=UPI000F787372|nr:hypothetical protein [Pseudoalteromonas rubra]